jgi:hypothetical protein
MARRACLLDIESIDVVGSDDAEGAVGGALLDQRLPNFAAALPKAISNL